MKQQNLTEGCPGWSQQQHKGSPRGTKPSEGPKEGVEGPEGDGRAREGKVGEKRDREVFEPTGGAAGGGA
eukprot:scaffold175171_cov50-Prasinocladus_malaysianus.AAC.1